MMENLKKNKSKKKKLGVGVNIHFVGKKSRAINGL